MHRHLTSTEKRTHRANGGRCPTTAGRSNSQQNEYRLWTHLYERLVAGNTGLYRLAALLSGAAPSWPPALRLSWHCRRCLTHGSVPLRCALLHDHRPPLTGLGPSTTTDCTWTVEQVLESEVIKEAASNARSHLTSAMTGKGLVAVDNGVKTH